MKAIIILLLAFVALSMAGSVKDMMERFGKQQKESDSNRKRANYQKQCSTLSCVKNGEQCGYQSLLRTFFETDCIDYNVDYCAVTQTGGNYQQGTCIRYATVGQSCGTANNDVECAPGLSCDFFQNVCIADTISNTTRYPGRQCGARNINCYYYNMDTMTSENVCNNRVCKFTANGSPCNRNDGTQCNFDSYCLIPTLSSTGTCTAKVPVNGGCNTGADTLISAIQCVEGLVCVPTTTNSSAGTCRELFSQGEGTPCIDSQTCKDGLCAPREYNYKYGVCKDFEKTSTLNKACASNNDCTTANGESCVCENEEKSVCKHIYFAREYQEETDNYDDCLDNAEFDCSGLSDVEESKCYTDACKKTFCKYYDARKDVYGGAGNAGADCQVVQYCGAASSLLASLPILLAAAVLALLVQ